MKSLSNKLAPMKIGLKAGEKYTRLFSAKNDSAASLNSGCVVLKENESVGEHNTEDKEEILIILEGKGQLFVKGYENINFEKNTALYVPPDTAHDVKNTGTGLLKYVFITCSASKAI